MSWHLHVVAYDPSKWDEILALLDGPDVPLALGTYLANLVPKGERSSLALDALNATTDRNVWLEACFGESAALWPSVYLGRSNTLEALSEKAGAAPDGQGLAQLLRELWDQQDPHLSRSEGTGYGIVNRASPAFVARLRDAFSHFDPSLSASAPPIEWTEDGELRCIGRLTFWAAESGLGLAFSHGELWRLRGRPRSGESQELVLPDALEVTAPVVLAAASDGTRASTEARPKRPLLFWVYVVAGASLLAQLIRSLLER